MTRFCGGSFDSESSVFALKGEMVGCAVAFACPFFVLVARCNVRFVLAALIKYTYSSVSLMGGTSSFSFLGNKFEPKRN